MPSLYDKYILPKITHLLCASNPVMKQRQKIVPQAGGRVLEIGVGSGLNFRYYEPKKVKHLFALDPSEEMWALAKSKIDNSNFNIEFLKASAEQIPLDDHQIDTILITYTLCSIATLQECFYEMRRVMKPEGVLLFCEHGLAPDPSVKKWQNRLNPVWKKLGGGCNLNRNIPKLIEQGGFKIENLNTMYIPGFKPACFNYWGAAKPLN